MKTAMQQLIEFIDPMHSAILNKAVQLLDAEKQQIVQAYEIGNNDYANFNYVAENGNNYYEQMFKSDYAPDGQEEKGCVELSSWEAADKVTLNGYVYVRSADLTFCKGE